MVISVICGALILKFPFSNLNKLVFLKNFGQSWRFICTSAKWFPLAEFIWSNKRIEQLQSAKNLCKWKFNQWVNSIRKFHLNQSLYFDLSLRYSLMQQLFQQYSIIYQQQWKILLKSMVLSTMDQCLDVLHHTLQFIDVIQLIY